MLLLRLPRSPHPLVRTKSFDSTTRRGGELGVCLGRGGDLATREGLRAVLSRMVAMDPRRIRTTVSCTECLSMSSSVCTRPRLRQHRAPSTESSTCEAKSRDLAGHLRGGNGLLLLLVRVELRHRLDVVLGGEVVERKLHALCAQVQLVDLVARPQQVVQVPLPSPLPVSLWPAA
eukprot:1509077-Rhodomonas_salina.1